MTELLEAQALAVGWGTRTMLRGLDFAVCSHEKLALLGSNGSGKTTLLRALAGLAAPMSGRLCWPGRKRGRAASVVFQREPPPAFTVQELVTLGLGLDGPPSTLQRRHVAQVLEEEDLAPFAGVRCSALSGGEWQRCVIARAVVSDPALLLLDEPSNHLDPARRATLHDRLARPGKRAMVVATHDLELAARCDRVMLLAHGTAIALGPPAEVLTPELLALSLGVSVRRLEDPLGGPPFFRIGGVHPRAPETSRMPRGQA